MIIAVTASMYMDGGGKIMKSILPVGSSIGLHTHTTSYELDYVRLKMTISCS